MHPFGTYGIPQGIYHVRKTFGRVREANSPSTTPSSGDSVFSTEEDGHSLEVLVKRQGDLWRHVDEALAQQQPHGLAGVAQDLLQLLRHAGRCVLLTAIQEELPHLLHTLNVLSTSQC